VLGAVSVSRLDAETLESLYAQLRRCRERCGGRRQAGHTCRPLAPATVRLIHANLSAALSSAVRWRWLAVNPATQAAKPTVPKSNPQPPSGQEAARIVVEAWKDPDCGMLVWLAMLTGARRGELCALRWDCVDFTTGVLRIRTSIAQQGATTWEKDTKTHQQRRITLDPQTLVLLRTYHARRVELAAAVGVELPSDARIFSPVPDGSEWVSPTRSACGIRARVPDSGGTCTFTSSGTTQRPNSSPPAWTCAPWPADLVTAEVGPQP
jgi:integrase